MFLPCPKCGAMTEYDGSNVPSEGVSSKCSACNTRFWISRESFALRAFRKEGKAFCSHCNHVMANYLNCPDCGSLYPDICIAQLSKPVKRKQRKTSASIGFSIRPERRSRTISAAPVEKSSKSILSVLVLLIVVVLAATGIGVAIYNSRANDAYTKAYFRALAGLKQGAEQNIKLCTNLTTEARKTGLKLSSLVTDKDKTQLISAKSDVDLIMGRIPKSPQKYIKANESLAKLYGVYTQTYNLASAPSGSEAVFADSAANLEREFKKVSQELKGNMTSDMTEKFQQLAKKNSRFQDF